MREFISIHIFYFAEACDGLFIESAFFQRRVKSQRRSVVDEGVGAVGGKAAAHHDRPFVEDGDQSRHNADCARKVKS